MANTKKVASDAENDNSLAFDKNANVEGSVNMKDVLKKHGEKGTKIKFGDRVKVRILKDMQYLKEGQILSIAKFKAQAYIDNGVAEKYVEEDED